MNTDTKPNVLIVYFSLTQQSARVAGAMEDALRARGCAVTQAPLEFTDERWALRLSRFPMAPHPIPQIASILFAQLRHKTGEIRIPPEAQEGDYDLVLFASPTWWFQTSMPMRSYLESSAARSVLNGKPFACASISRRYYRFNLAQMKKLAEKNGGRFVDQTHFVAAGGQVKSMLSWLGYVKHGEPQERVFGLKMPPPNLKTGFPEQARSFIDGVAEEVLALPAISSAGDAPVVEAESAASSG